MELFAFFKEEFEDKYTFTHAGDLDNQQNILKDIVQGIYCSDIVVADLSGLNPNVFYELGIAHTMNKKVIIITQSIDELPFDLQQYRANEYITHFSKIKLIRDKLNNLLDGAINGFVQFGSPVSDYVPDFFSTQQINSASTEISIPNNDQKIEIPKSDDFEYEKGLLDFSAEIEEDVEAMTESLTKISDEIRLLGERVSEKNTDINKVTSTGGAGTSSFMRSIARKVAEDINLFCKNVEPENIILATLWDKVENNFLDLIDNKFVDTEENSDSLIKSVDNLSSMSDAVPSTRVIIENFSTVVNNLRGVERRLNQSIDSMDKELHLLLTTMDQIVAGVTRIQEKSKMLLKEKNNSCAQ